MNHDARIDAVKKGHTNVVKMLIPHVYPSANNNQAIRWASDADPRLSPDPSACGNQAIISASVKGQALLADPRVNPSAQEDYAISWASAIGHTDVVKALVWTRLLIIMNQFAGQVTMVVRK